MKNILALALLISLSACNNTVDDSLESKKQTLSQKKAELKSLEEEINALTSEIQALEPANEKVATPVETIKIAPSNFERFVEVQGRVAADDIVNVSSEVGGRITRILAKEGDYVRKGQLLATTDLETIERQINEIETQLGLAETVFERQQRLWEQNIGSEIQYLEAKTRKESLEKSLETLRAQEKKKNIYAPISGYLDKEFMKEGETVSPGMPILQILNTASVKIVADIQENFLKTLQKGDSVTVRFPALGMEIEETISLLGRTIDLNNRTFEIEINTASRNGQLKPNLLSIIRFKDYEKENILSIPLDVIHEEVSGKKYVFLAREKEGDYLAQKSYIELGESNVNEVIIKSGIAEGDLLVTRGSKGISDGDLIKSNL